MDSKENKLIQSLQNAKAIMHMTGDVTPQPKSAMGMVNDYSPINEQYTMPQPSQEKKQPNNSRLPKAIFESLTNNPLDEGNSLNFLEQSELTNNQSQYHQVNNAMMAEGGDDMRDLFDTSSVLKERLKQKGQQQIMESASVGGYHGGNPVATHNMATPQSNMITSHSNIDYSIIKMIVKDVVNEAIGELVKNLSNEGLAIIKVDKELNLITNNGNIYSGKMKRTGNIKEK